MQYIKIPITGKLQEVISGLAGPLLLKTGECTFYGHKAEIVDDIAPAEKPAPLSEFEQEFGAGETPQSVWEKYCPCPEKYGEPRYEPVPARTRHGWVYDEHSFIGDSTLSIGKPVLWAPRLPDPPKKRFLKVPLIFGSDDMVEVVSNLAHGRRFLAREFPGATIVEEDAK